MCKVTIRPAVLEDMSAAAEIEKQTFSQPWSEQGLQDTLAFPNVIFLTIHDAEELAGYCVMYCALDEGEVTNVAVKEKSRGLGFGKKLMEALLAEAKRRGVFQIVLEVRVSNEPAIGLYQTLGFQIQGTRRDFYQQPREDAYVMILSQ